MNELELYHSVLSNEITKAISHIDASRAARQCGDLGSAESALNRAREVLIDLLGIK